MTGAGLNDDFGSAYPIFTGKGMIMKGTGTGDFVIEGNFPAETEIQFLIGEIHLGGTLHLEADGTEVFSHEYNRDPVGENDFSYTQPAILCGLI